MFLSTFDDTAIHIIIIIIIINIIAIIIIKTELLTMIILLYNYEEFRNTKHFSLQCCNKK